MPAQNFLTQATPFIGRTDELVEIARLLSNLTCRPLTLVGAGGIGKTHIHNICRNLEVFSRTQAIARAHQLNLV